MPDKYELLYFMHDRDGEELSAPEVAEILGSHPNAIRTQLNRLWTDEMVGRRRATGREGRPAYHYKISAQGKKRVLWINSQRSS